MNGNRSAYTRSVFGNVIPETPSPPPKRHRNVPIATSPQIISTHSVSNVGSRTTPSRAGATGVRRKSSTFVPKFPIKCQLQSHVRTVDDVIERARTSRSRSRSRLRSRTDSARSRSSSLDQKSSQQSAVRSTTPRSSSSCYSSSSNSALQGSSPSLSDDDEDLVDESADGEDVKDGSTDGENAVDELTDGEDIADECDEESVSLLERSKRKKPIPKKAKAINYTSDEMDFSD
ncbi:hypothetical protein QAD02_006819 [Eretmocerus hayati]|uniref:Uncharacterized protein n=1 Tax=Eretmocerus hayati TaxID=131215 RepID=A0ACC2N496_9HYME|nr:hypothetical protein QAD02_006819 [Eretmocerus hayati]